MADWNPEAQKVAGRDAGGFTGGGAKIVLHTTEGSSAQGAIAAFRNTGSWPHFTISPTDLYQHLPISRAARALEHRPGTCETNRDNCVQIEMVGFAKSTPNWPPSYLRRIGELCQWIEDNHGVPSKAGVRFAIPATRLSCVEWHSYSGYCGHEHVPNNSHYDPGAFPIKAIVDAKPKPSADKRKVAAWRKHLQYAQGLLRVRSLPLPLRTELNAYAKNLRELIKEAEK